MQQVGVALDLNSVPAFVSVCGRTDCAGRDCWHCSWRRTARHIPGQAERVSYVSNSRVSLRTEAGLFMIEQRNAGFADNDGQWVVSQLPELYWSPIGVLRQRRAGAFLGVFPDRGAAEVAIAAAAAQPIDDRMVI